MTNRHIRQPKAESNFHKRHIKTELEQTHKTQKDTRRQTDRHKTQKEANRQTDRQTEQTNKQTKESIRMAW